VAAHIGHMADYFGSYKPDVVVVGGIVGTVIVAHVVVVVVVVVVVGDNMDYFDNTVGNTGLDIVVERRPDCNWRSCNERQDIVVVVLHNSDDGIGYYIDVDSLDSVVENS
jgi:hypothetical protein